MAGEVPAPNRTDVPARMAAPASLSGACRSPRLVALVPSRASSPCRWVVAACTLPIYPSRGRPRATSPIRSSSPEGGVAVARLLLPCARGACRSDTTVVVGSGVADCCGGRWDRGRGGTREAWPVARPSCYRAGSATRDRAPRARAGFLLQLTNTEHI